MWPVLPFCSLQPIQGTSHQAAQSCSMESIRMVGRVGKSSLESLLLQFCPGNWSCWLAQTSCRIPRCITYNSEKRKRISQAVLKTPIPVTDLTDPDHSVSKESLPGWQGPLAISFQTLGLSKTFEWNMVVMFCISFVGDLGSRSKMLFILRRMWGICDPYHQYQPDFFHTTIPLFFDRSGELDEEAVQDDASRNEISSSVRSSIGTMVLDPVRWA